MGLAYHYKCADCDRFWFGDRICPKCGKLADIMDFKCDDCGKGFWCDTGTGDTGTCPYCGKAVCTPVQGEATK